MWTIKDIKERGKICYRKNTWRAILVAFVILLIGGMQGSNGIKGIVSVSANFISSFAGRSSGDDVEWKDYTDNHSDNKSKNDSDNDGIYDSDDIDDDFVNQFENEFGYDAGDFVTDSSDAFAAVAVIFVVVMLIILVFCIIASIIGLIVRFFLWNPLFVGTQRFFVHNLSGMGQIGDIGFGFDRFYKNQVNVMFFRDLYTFAWSLLFYFPGLYKSYEYRMIPYLLAEYPDMSKDRAFFTSKYMMNGNKWKAFIFDLSFIGWWILNIFTLGLLGLFFVNPYYASSCAAMYEAIKSIKGIPEYRDPRQMYDPVTGNPITPAPASDEMVPPGGNPPMPTPVYRPSSPVFPMADASQTGDPTMTEDSSTPNQGTVEQDAQSTVYTEQFKADTEPDNQGTNNTTED